MIKFDILNRLSGEVQFTAEIECDGKIPRSIKLGLAIKKAIEVKANLYGANLRSADLRSANLSSADLRSANLSDNPKLPAFQIPQEGELIVYKKTTAGVVKLRIPPEAKRTSTPIGRKCRAEFVEVLEAPDDAWDCHSHKIQYIAGQIIRPDSYDPNPVVECTNGIHFFLTREEAENY